MADMQATHDDSAENAQSPEVLEVSPRSVTAVLDDPDVAQKLVDSLGRQGVERENVEVISGPVAPQTDLRSRLMRLLQSHGEEPDMKDGFEKELNDGHAIIVVHDVSDGDEERLGKLLTAAGARDVHYYGKFTVTRLKS